MRFAFTGTQKKKRPQCYADHLRGRIHCCLSVYMLLVVVNVCLLKLNLTTCLYSLQRGYSARLFLRVIAGDAVWCLRTDNFGNVQNRVLKIAVRRFFFVFFFWLCLCVHTGSRWDFANTQRERAAVMRRSIHVLGILCFRLPDLLRCLVTTKR